MDSFFEDARQENLTLALGQVTCDWEHEFWIGELAMACPYCGAAL
jgi:hypothetical protein